MQNESTGLSWYENLKQSLNPGELLEKLKASKGTIIDLFLYLGIGFLFGFLLKRYGQYIVFFAVALFVLAHLNIMQVSVHWDSIQNFLGLHQIGNVEGNVFTVFWEWVKLNAIVVLSFCVGFTLGIKIG
jgi:hypothetical protein